jgi:hypothetical protein
MDESTKLNGNEPELDEELVAEVMTGAMQLLFNLVKNNRLGAYVILLGKHWRSYLPKNLAWETVHCSLQNEIGRVHKRR